jgi:hypothetical protein
MLIIHQKLVTSNLKEEEEKQTKNSSYLYKSLGLSLLKIVSKRHFMVFRFTSAICSRYFIECFLGLRCRHRNMIDIVPFRMYDGMDA